MFQCGYAFAHHILREEADVPGRGRKQEDREQEILAAIKLAFVVADIPEELETLILTFLLND
jgi:hypothetical protein